MEVTPGHPGPVGGRRGWRGGRSSVGRGGGKARLACVECQLIMSLLLTPYVEFFMLSLTSRRNTDRFWVNLRQTEQG